MTSRQHLTQQEPWRALQGWLKAGATREELRRAEEWAWRPRGHLEAPREAVPILPSGRRHKHPEPGTPWQSSSGARWHLHSQSHKTISQQATGQSWPGETPLAKRLPVLQASDSSNCHVSQNDTQGLFYSPWPQSAGKTRPPAKLSQEQTASTQAS